MRVARLVAAAVLALALGAALGASGAHAGTWTLISCTHPDGTPAPTARWSPGMWAAAPPGAITTGSGDVNTCATGGSLTAVSSAAGQPPSYTGPEWVFTAPPGAWITGGSITASLTSPQGQAWIGTPTPAYDGDDVIAACTLGAACGDAGTASGVFGIAHPGGTSLYAPALCIDASAQQCPPGAAGAVNAEVSIHAADIELAENAVPTAGNVSGGLLRGRARGIADLRFVARDPLPDGGFGPGVYAVVVQIDGSTVYSGPPNPATPCASLGADPATGGQMFDRTQPCPRMVHATVPIDTATLADGVHTLTVVVEDAGSATATVITRHIRTFNPLVSPVPGAGVVPTRLTVGWAGASPDVAIHSVSARHLPRRGHVSIRCLGRHCPELARHSARVARVGRLWSALKAASFRTGQRLRIVIYAPGRRSERIQYTIQPTGLPGQRLLR